MHENAEGKYTNMGGSLYEAQAAAHAVGQGVMDERRAGAVRAAGAIEAAMGRLLREGQVRTPDLGGSSHTGEVGDAISALLETK